MDKIVRDAAPGDIVELGIQLKAAEKLWLMKMILIPTGQLANIFTTCMITLARSLITIASIA